MGGDWLGQSYCSHDFWEGDRRAFTARAPEHVASHAIAKSLAAWLN